MASQQRPVRKSRARHHGAGRSGDPGLDEMAATFVQGRVVTDRIGGTAGGSGAGVPAGLRKETPADSPVRSGTLPRLAQPERSGR